MKVRSHHVRGLTLALVALAALLAAPASASAITRSQVLARGKVWADRFVPYSQSGYADESGTVVASRTAGWRRDCSGFASYCLGLRYPDGRPLSLDSASILSVLTPIDKADLLPGDIVDRPNNLGYAYGHAIVFDCWADAEQTMYWAYEESGGTGGAVHRLVPYPFWSAPGFAPYRYRGIEEAWDAWVEPVEGATRYQTAVRASLEAFPETGSAGTVVVCSGLAWPDALGGSALAGAVGGPVLLTDPATLAVGVAAELRRLEATRVIVVGGEGAVSATVAAGLAGAGIARVDRIGGADRYETARLVAGAVIAELAARGRAADGTAYLASGENFPDALAVSPAAARFARPVLLTPASRLSTPAAAALASLAATRVVVLGGVSAVGTEAAVSAAEGRVLERLAGRDRYGTAAAIARHSVSEGMSWAGAGVASGRTFADALAGGAAQGRLGAPLLLTPTRSLAAAAAVEIRAHAAEIGQVRCYGGPSAVAPCVRSAIAVYLGMP